GLDEEAPREWAFERHAHAARVQRRTAPVVVRVPGRRRQQEEDRRGVGRVGSNDEERVGAVVAGGHGDGVVPRPPCAHGALERGGPAAAVRGRVVARVVRSAGDALGAPDGFGPGSLSQDGDVEGGGVGGDEQLDRLAATNRGRPTVRLERHLASTKYPAITITAPATIGAITQARPGPPPGGPG